MKLNYLIDMQTEIEIEAQEPKVILIVGSHCTHAQVAAAIVHSNTFNDFIFEIIEKDVEESVKELIEKTRGTAVLPQIPISLMYAKPLVVEKTLPTYKQDRSKKYYNRFLK
jgi:hypothetical protein